MEEMKIERFNKSSFYNFFNSVIGKDREFRLSINGDSSGYFENIKNIAFGDGTRIMYVTVPEFNSKDSRRKSYTLLESSVMSAMMRRSTDNVINILNTKYKVIHDITVRDTVLFFTNLACSAVYGSLHRGYLNTTKVIGDELSGFIEGGETMAFSLSPFIATGNTKAIEKAIKVFKEYGVDEDITLKCIMDVLSKPTFKNAIRNSVSILKFLKRKKEQEEKKMVDDVMSEVKIDTNIVVNVPADSDDDSNTDKKDDSVKGDSGGDTETQEKHEDDSDGKDGDKENDEQEKDEQDKDYESSGSSVGDGGSSGSSDIDDEILSQIEDRDFIEDTIKAMDEVRNAEEQTRASGFGNYNFDFNIVNNREVDEVIPELKTKLENIKVYLRTRKTMKNTEDGIDIDTDNYIQKRFNHNIDDIFFADRNNVGIMFHIVIDASGSMSDASSMMKGKNKLETLNIVANTVYQVFKDIAKFSIYYYDGDERFINIKVSNKPIVLGCGNATPTLDVIKYVANKIKENRGQNVKNILILMTDGMPNLLKGNSVRLYGDFKGNLVYKLIRNELNKMSSYVPVMCIIDMGGHSSYDYLTKCVKYAFMNQVDIARDDKQMSEMFVNTVLSVIRRYYR
jgi:hypothetical protein